MLSSTMKSYDPVVTLYGLTLRPWHLIKTPCSLTTGGSKSPADDVFLKAKHTAQWGRGIFLYFILFKKVPFLSNSSGGCRLKPTVWYAAGDGSSSEIHLLGMSTAGHTMIGFPLSAIEISQLKTTIVFALDFHCSFLTLWVAGELCPSKPKAETLGCSSQETSVHHTETNVSWALLSLLAFQITSWSTPMEMP